MVDVRIPAMIELEAESATPEGLLSFLIVYIDDIYWKGLFGGIDAFQLIQAELTRLNIKVDKNDRFNTEVALRAFDREIVKNRNYKVHRQLFKILNPTL